MLEEEYFTFNGLQIRTEYLFIVLDHLEKKYGETFPYSLNFASEVADDLNLGTNYTSSILGKLDRLEFTYDNNKTEKSEITLKGLKFLSNERERRLKESNFQSQEAEHRRNEMKLTKLQVTWFYPLLLIAVFGGIYSLYDFSKELFFKKDEIQLDKNYIQEYVDSVKIEILKNLEGQEQNKIEIPTDSTGL